MIYICVFTLKGLTKPNQTNQSLGSNQKRVAFSPVCSQAKTRQSKLDIADTIEIRFDTNNLETY
ncbi:hypothetical protein pb186bvf_011411 [Paramecium bursaria]